MKKKCWRTVVAALTLATVLVGCGKEVQETEISTSAVLGENTEASETGEDLESKDVEKTSTEDNAISDVSYEWKKLEEPEKGVATVKEIVWYLQDCNLQEPQIIVYTETRDFNIMNIGEEYTNDKQERSSVYIFYPGKMTELTQSNEEFYLSNTEVDNLLWVVSPQYGHENGEDTITISTEEGQNFQFTINVETSPYIEPGVGKVVTDWVGEEPGSTLRNEGSSNGNLNGESDKSIASENVSETLPAEMENINADLIEKVDISGQVIDMDEFLESVNYTTPKIIMWEHDAIYGLSDGAAYEGSGAIFLYVPKGKDNIAYIDCTYEMVEQENVWAIPNVNLDLNEKNKVICRMTYTDGTKDQIIVYITRRDN